MVFQKSIDLPFPFNGLEFLILDEFPTSSDDHFTIRRNLVVVDKHVPGGLRLISEATHYENTGWRLRKPEIDRHANQPSPESSGK